MLFAGQSQRLLVTVCGPKARQRGVRVGQPLAEAKVLLPKGKFLAADFEADRRALCQLALDAQRFSPLVGLEEGPLPEALLSDVAGCTHLWNGEERFVAAVRRYWVERGYRVQLALAGTVGAAWALARAAGDVDVVVPVGHEEPALANLGVALLRLPIETWERLDSLGLGRIRDVLRLPREALASRFGAILPRRLDQALGLLPEMFECERLSEPLAVAREWETPVEDRFAVTLACGEMLRALLGMADHPGAGIQELRGELRTEAGLVALEIRLARPSRDERHLAQLVELQLERRAWAGGVVAIRWSVERLGRLEQVQRSWLADAAETDHLPAVVALVDRLGSRLGPNSVLRAWNVPDAQPECAVKLTRWVNSRHDPPNTFTPLDEQSRRRPSRLLADPEPLEVVSVVPDGPPIRASWQHQEKRVVRFWGPERIATGWWRSLDVQRDYYRVEWDDGTHAWIYRDLRGNRWFLHGFFE